MPEMIVVALPNTDRIRDLAPPGETIRDIKTAGDQFLNFLTDELIPWVDARYRTHPFRVLLGHSRGGLFNVYTLLEKPDAFQAHIAASPFEGWNGGLLHKRALAEITRVPKNRFLYMTAGEEEQGFAIRGATEELVDHLRKHSGSGPTWHYEVLKGESHNSTPLRTLYDGLSMLFAGWSPDEDTRRAGLGAITKHYETLSAKYGFPVRPPATVLNTLGNGMVQRKEVDAAVAVFKQALEYYPQNRYLYESLSTAYEAGQRWPEAHAAYARAFELARPMLSGAALTRFEQRLAMLRAKLPAPGK
jgi:tetratricopeptide (TPR) repeat protein